jgi:hypothetical protein
LSTGYVSTVEQSLAILGMRSSEDIKHALLERVPSFYAKYEPVKVQIPTLQAIVSVQGVVVHVCACYSA